MRILVFGGSGFIGSYLCPVLAESGHVVRALDVSDGDISVPGEAERLVADFKPDCVVHLAATVGREYCETVPFKTVAVNAAGSALVAKAAEKFDARLVYASSSEVYGDMGDTLAREWMEPALPHNLYGLSKMWGEEACRLYAPWGLLILRLSMPYGPGLPWGFSRAAVMNFLYNAWSGEEIVVHRGAKRSWCFVGDLVRQMKGLIERTDVDGVFNVGRDDDLRSMREIAELCCDVVGRGHDRIVEIDPPARVSPVKRLCTDKVESVLGLRPQVELEEGLRLTFEWIKDVAEWRAV